MQISDRTHLSPEQSIKDLTVAELRTLIYLTVEELLLEFFGDPDQGLTLNPNMLRQLLAQQQQRQQTKAGISTLEVLQELGHRRDIYDTP
jgi:hypothetical protein